MTGGERRERLSRALFALEVVNPESAAAAITGELEERYGEAHRAYHTLDHVESCLAWLDWFHAQAEYPAEVELALWFHDAVYDPTRSDNEKRSAELAAERLSAVGASSSAVRRIATLTVATKRHKASRGDAALLCSIDLSILGAAPAAYAQYETAVRREYAHVPDAVYQAGRAAFLAALLARPSIYANRAIAAELEEKARLNLRGLRCA